MRTITPASLTSLVLALALAGCGGDQAKNGETKAMAVVPAAETSMKEGPSAKAMQSQVYTATTVEAATKTLSELRLGESARGDLGGGDDQLPNGQYVDLFVFEVTTSTQVDLQVSSSDFDTYLMLMAGLPGEDVEIVASDDDGGDGTNSRLAGWLRPGAYTAVVSSYGAGETGSYTLASSAGSAEAEGSATGGRLEPGSAVSGRLTGSSPTLNDGSHYQLWQFQGQGGEQVTITLRSDDFDAYLMLIQGTSMAGAEILASDDDGAGGLNSQIVYTLPESGTYSAVANSYGAGATGSYRIELSTVSADWDDRYPGGGDPDDQYAVVVGIDDYPGTRADLRGPVDDATLVRDALVNKFGFSPGNIVFLRDGEATRLGIANAILRHLGQAGPNGTAVFFYSGHGTQLDENLGITGRLDPESGNNVDEALAVHGGLILDEELNFLLQQIEAENTLVLVDACYSGTVNRAPDALAKFIPADQTDDIHKPSTFITADLTMDFGFGAGASTVERALSNPDRHVFMAASSEDQVSWAIGSWPDRSGPASLWTYYWAQVVNEVPTSTTFAELQRMVSERVNRHVDRSQGLSTQTPQLLAPSSKANMSIGAFLGAN